jgi:UDP-N-acetylmuramoyl-tripeptide--D-alanyl-D-alanine ligase
MNQALSAIALQLKCPPPADPDIQVTGISIDTRTLKPGDLFVAIVGENFDGHDFVDQASQKGAVACLVQRQVQTDCPQLIVSDTKLSLGQLASWYRSQYPIPLIALTGSNGKTTVKEMIAAILRQQGPILATQGNLNNDLGVPLTLFNLQSDQWAGVVELGANHPGEIAYTSALVKPQVALITNIGDAHIEGFGSKNGVAETKSEIYQNLNLDGVAIINADSDYADFFRQRIGRHPILSFGVSGAPDVKAEFSGTNDSGQTMISLQTPTGHADIALSLLGQHQAANVAAAATATMALGLSVEQVKNGLQTLKAVPGRLFLCEGPADSKVIDDTYNANPNSMFCALECLQSFSGEKIAVLGDMGELGPDTEQYHAAIGDKAKACQIDRLLTCGTYSRHMTDAFGAGAQHFETQAQLQAVLAPLLNPSVTCLVKGSRAAQMENIVQAMQGMR